MNASIILLVENMTTNMTNKYDNYIVSVCVSVYNGEKHLRKCLDSVFSQDIKNMEIILVNDGSEDNTLQIMNEYKASFPQIKIIVVEQKHSGLAQGRLTGVRHATGNYVSFIDVDDYLVEGAYCTILDFMEGNEADIYEFQTIREGYLSKSPYTGVKDAKSVLIDYFNGVGIPVNYWLRWFRRELLTESVFPVGISLHEDVYAFPCILHRAETIAYIDMPLHVHTKNESSIMGRLYADKNGREYFEKQKTFLMSIPHIASNIGQDVIEREYKEPFKHYILRLYLSFLFMDVKDVSYEEKLDAIIDTLKLNMSRNQLERYIRENVPLNCKMNCAIRMLGLRNAYKLLRLKTSISGINRG